MTAALHQTFTALSDALVAVAREPTFGDLLAWERTANTRTHIRTALDLYQLGEADEPVSKLRYRLDRAIGRERLKAAKRHWSFCPIRFGTLLTVLEIVNRFERRTA